MPAIRDAPAPRLCDNPAMGRHRPCARRRLGQGFALAFLLAAIEPGPATAAGPASPPDSIGLPPVPDRIAAAWGRALAAPPPRPQPAGQHRGDDDVRPWQRPNTAASTTVFEKFPSNPVLRLGNKGSLDAGHAEYPSVVAVDDLLWMYYSAYGAHRRWEIAAAVSPDGISWTKLGVVFSPDTTAAAWDSTTIAFPCVLHTAGAPPAERFRMWYAGKRGPRYEGIGFATSADGRAWRREGRVLAIGEAGAWDGVQVADPAVIAVDGGYRMYYCGAVDPDGLFAVGVALSADGRSWVKMPDNPVYTAGPASPGVYTVDVIRDGVGFILFVSAPGDGGDYEIRAIPSADGLVFDPAAGRVVLRPARDNSWDDAMVYGMDVVPSGGELFMWFNGIYARNVAQGGEVGFARATQAALAQLFGRF